ncbi:Serine/threonine-protein phosphatase 2A 55 kDa regulatory subunit B delta isoform [Schistosoma japonicum]|nr:Serine/threonine-protein phosphatase 2A 55 kDa regulatory subunit B delta isoform [Schistosoma japonicum]
MHKTLCESVRWYVSQIKGSTSEDIGDGDNFTCVEFNESGELLATGDKAGRVTVFKNNKDIGLYDIYCTFTSHEPEFDYLKSLEIEEKINSITWLQAYTSAHHLLSANDKTIKLWRLSERQYEAYNFNIRDDENACLWYESTDRLNMIGPPIPHIITPDKLRIPKFRKSRHLTIEARPKRLFANAHAYHINAVSVNSDQETFLSADDLRINLWHLDVSNQSFTIVDLKPSNMEDLTEVITCSRFHPVQCNILAYSTSRGLIRLCDMRYRALCDNHILVFEDPSLSQNLGFFADIIASLSDFRFGHTGNYLLARDYLTLKIHEPFRSQLCMLYENDAIFDKFLCGWSDDDRYAITGSYGNLFHIFDRHNGSDWLYDLDDSNILYNTNPTCTTGNYLPPKRFMSPNDPIGSQLGLSSVFVAPLDALDALFPEITSQTSSNSSYSDNNDWNKFDDSQNALQVSPGKAKLNCQTQDPLTFPENTPSPPTGSKRRKQTLPSRTNDSADSNCSVQGKHKGSHRHHKSKHRHHNKHSSHDGTKSCENGVSSSCAVENSNNDHELQCAILNSPPVEKTSIEEYRSGALTVPGMHQIHCQRKILHLSWHPKKLLTVAISGNQLFLVAGQPTFSDVLHSQKDSSLCSSCVSKSTDDENNILSEHSEVFEARSAPVVDQLCPISPQNSDVKAAKRRRRRHHQLDRLSSVSPPSGVVDEMENHLSDIAVLPDKSMICGMDCVTNYEADHEDNYDKQRTSEGHLNSMSPDPNTENIPCIDSLFSSSSETISINVNNVLQ